jgi:putative oxidoreductase
VSTLRSLVPTDRHFASLYRLVLGLLISCHGAATLFGVFGGAQGTGHTVPPLQWPGGVAALIQLAGGLLVLFGLATRPAAVIVSGSMAYAYFDVHQRHALLPIQNGGEPAALFCWGFLLVAILGAGPWSLDALVKRARGGASGLPRATAGQAAARVLQEA